MSRSSGSNTQLYLPFVNYTLTSQAPVRFANVFCAVVKLGQKLLRIFSALIQTELWMGLRSASVLSIRLGPNGWQESKIC